MAAAATAGDLECKEEIAANLRHATCSQLDSAISLSGVYNLARTIREPGLRNLRLVSVLLQVQWFVGFTSLYSSLCTGLVCSRV